MYEIYMGIPQMEEYWDSLTKKVNSKTCTKGEALIYKKLLKTFRLLSDNPRHKSLHTHEIKELIDRYEMKVWESYIDNKTPNALRLFWVYYPNGGITIIGVEPHPNDKKNAYKKINLSNI